MPRKPSVALALPEKDIVNRIFFIRGQKVMIDRDLAEMYGVETRVLKQAVRRNITRFPEDFMFEMTSEELENWRSQFVTSNSDKMGLRYAPFCFTEQGVAMLSSVLNSETAIQVNIQIIRVFAHMKSPRTAAHPAQMSIGDSMWQLKTSRQRRRTKKIHT
jgi:hypothetical protein